MKKTTVNDLTNRATLPPSNLMPSERSAVRATYVHSRETTPEIVSLYAPVVAEKALSILVHILVLTTQPNTSRCARFNAAKRKMKQPVNRAILSSFRLVFAIAISSCKTVPDG